MTSLYHGDIAALVLERAALTTCSLSHGLEILRVLPAAEQPSTCSALLARGIVDPPIAVALGYASLLKKFPAWLLLEARTDIIKALAMTGDLTAIKTFYLKVPSMHPPIQLEGSEHGVLVDATLESGHVCILEWVVATAAQEQWEIDWHDWSWGSVAKLGHISALEWALRNDIFQLSAFSHAVVGPAARHGQLQVLVWYHAQLQVRGGETFSMGVSNMIARSAAQGAHRRVLDWWWVNIASTFTPCLPYPKPFDGIVAAALSNGDLATVQWLWDKYDAHHTPDHAFATPAALISALSSGSLLAVEWLWAIAAQPEWVEILYNWNGEPYTSYLGNRFATSLPLLKWWYQTQAYAGGDPVVVCTRAYTFACAKAGAVEVLDWVISLPDQSKVVWGESLAATALLHRQQQVLE